MNIEDENHNQGQTPTKREERASIRASRFKHLQARVSIIKGNNNRLKRLVS